VSRHDQIRETFYNDLDVDTATAAISLLSTDGPATPAAANRHHLRDPQRALKLLQAA
jgi:hypothetical protein